MPIEANTLLDVWFAFPQLIYNLNRLARLASVMRRTLAHFSTTALTAIINTKMARRWWRAAALRVKLQTAGVCRAFIARLVREMLTRNSASFLALNTISYGSDLQTVVVIMPALS